MSLSAVAEVVKDLLQVVDVVEVLKALSHGNRR